MSKIYYLVNNYLPVLDCNNNNIAYIINDLKKNYDVSVKNIVKIKKNDFYYYLAKNFNNSKFSIGITLS